MSPPNEYVDQCPRCRHIRPRPNGFNETDWGAGGFRIRKIGGGQRFTCVECDVPTVAVKSVNVPSQWPKDVAPQVYPVAVRVA